jgi:hypothetical protein
MENNISSPGFVGAIQHLERMDGANTRIKVAEILSVMCWPWKVDDGLGALETTGGKAAVIGLLKELSWTPADWGEMVCAVLVCRRLRGYKWAGSRCSGAN